MQVFFLMTPICLSLARQPLQESNLFAFFFKYFLTSFEFATDIFSIFLYLLQIIFDLVSEGEDKVFRREGLQRVYLFCFKFQLPQNTDHFEFEAEAHFLIFYLLLASKPIGFGEFTYGRVGSTYYLFAIACCSAAGGGSC